jgi:hypothetical protein
MKDFGGGINDFLDFVQFTFSENGGGAPVWARCLIIILSDVNKPYFPG